MAATAHSSALALKSRSPIVYIDDISFVSVTELSATLHQCAPILVQAGSHISPPVPRRSFQYLQHRAHRNPACGALPEARAAEPWRPGIQENGRLQMCATPRIQLRSDLRAHAPVRHDIA